MPVFVSIEGARRLEELSRRLKAEGRGETQRHLREQIQEAGGPVLRDLRRAVMKVKIISSRGGKSEPRLSTGLRARTSRATMISHTRHGIRIRVSERRFGDYGVTLPRYLDSSLPRWQRWRHPVFWPGPIGTAPAKRVVQQRGQPWFFTTIT
ncbi:MAG: hypothetical protein ACREQ3_24910, partial [Candidatus Binatia bacterium]